MSVTTSPIRSVPASHISARALAVGVAGLIAVAPLILAAPAQAAELPDVVSGVTVEAASGVSPIGRYERLEVRAMWSVPDNSRAGDTFSIGLPPELQGLTSTFALLDEDGGNFGSCEVTAAQVLCTLSDLVTSRPLDVGGNLFFSGRFTDLIVPGELNDLPFSTGSNIETVTVDVAPVTAYNGNGFRKSGRVNPDGSVTWFVDLPQSAAGLEEDLTNVIITDELDPALAFVGAERVRLTRASSLNSGGSGPLYTEAVDRATYSVELSGQTAVVTIPILESGFYYRLVIDTVATGGGVGSYSNSATLSASELASVESAVATVEFASGGDGGGMAPTAPVLTPTVPGVGSGVAPSAVPAAARPELAATGAPTPGTFGLAGFALILIITGSVMAKMRRSELAR